MDAGRARVHAVAVSTQRVAAPRTLDGDDRLLLGVAADVSRFLRLDVAVVRLALVGTAIGAPPLAAAYVLAYPLVTRRHAAPWKRVRGVDAHGLSATAGVLLIELAAVLAARQLGWTIPDPVLVTVLAGQAVLALAWRRLEGADRWSWLLGTSPQRTLRAGPLAVSADAVRMLLGIGLILLAVNGLTSGPIRWSLIGTLQQEFWPFELLALGVGIMIVPRLFRLGSRYTEERRDRIRADERARLATHLHDSVLQTLTLIQRHGGDPAAMAQLARRQERELRDWLYGVVASSDTGRLRDRLAALAAEIEDRYSWRVELIVVGDCDVGHREEALLAATREAIVNAARHSRAPLCDVYAECQPGVVQIWVRDRGKGFDPATVPGDRRGLAESVIRRMEQAAGSATVRSSAGGGTEVGLVLPAREMLV
jgi:signal transduction histidine kinase/phage shock protein PspC (stress-responsive transcriptional regulator)